MKQLGHNDSAAHLKFGFGLFILALLVRLFFFSYAVDQTSVDGLSAYSPDVKNYLKGGAEIAEHFEFNTFAVNTFGPGYPAFLGLLQSLFGPNLVLLTIINLLISAITVVLLARLGWVITGDCRVGYGAAVFMALSPTSVGLSGSLLSETFFVFLLVLGLLVFVKGLEAGAGRACLWSGLIFGVAALTRTMGQMVWVILLVTILVHHLSRGKFDFKKLIAGYKWPLTAVLLFIMITSGWMLRNNLLLNHSYLAFSQANAMGRVTSVARARRFESSLGDEWRNYRLELADSLKLTPGEYQTVARVARASASGELFLDPLNFLLAFTTNMDDQMHSQGLIMTHTHPKWKPRISKSMRWLKGYHYFSLLSLLALMGGVVLFIRGPKEYAVLLILLMAYFAFLSGFTFWQTRRIYYPAQVATTILLSLTLVSSYDWVAKWCRSRKSVGEHGAD